MIWWQWWILISMENSSYAQLNNLAAWSDIKQSFLAKRSHYRNWRWENGPYPYLPPLRHSGTKKKKKTFLMIFRDLTTHVLRQDKYQTKQQPGQCFHDWTMQSQSSTEVNGEKTSSIGFGEEHWKAEEDSNLELEGEWREDDSALLLENLADVVSRRRHERQTYGFPHRPSLELSPFSSAIIHLYFRLRNRLL